MAPLARPYPQTSRHASASRLRAPSGMASAIAPNAAHAMPSNFHAPAAAATAESASNPANAPALIRDISAMLTTTRRGLIMNPVFYGRTAHQNVSLQS
ncbi:DUF2275 domain-containing protein [Haloplanus sp. GCM10025708]|uniref:DUF2275 domain-containing protein n=1 Tax=Haloferacaceae TaxID=1644056 RepID=UPI00360CD23B